MEKDFGSLMKTDDEFSYDSLWLAVCGLCVGQRATPVVVGKTVVAAEDRGNGGALGGNLMPFLSARARREFSTTVLCWNKTVTLD